jgi:molybdenum cofactor cytidylyltransferase
VLVVLGAESARCAAALDGLDLATFTHEGWGEGLGSTIRVGVIAARKRWPNLAAVVLMSCDQPGVSPAALRWLVAAHAKAGAAAVASAYAGTVGIPALFARSELDKLEALVGDRGAKPLLESLGAGLTRVSCPDLALDVDTAADLGRLPEGPA